MSWVEWIKYGFETNRYEPVYPCDQELVFHLYRAILDACVSGSSRLTRVLSSYGLKMYIDQIRGERLCRAIASLLIS